MSGTLTRVEGIRVGSQISVDRLLAVLAEQVARQSQPRVLVAFDGPDAAGKTTMANALVGQLPGQVVLASIDGFHHPRERRLRRGSLSPEEYYRDSFDKQGLRRLLL